MSETEGKLIARNDYLELYAIDEKHGYIKDTRAGKTFPQASIATILTHGYWDMVGEEEEDANQD